MSETPSPSEQQDDAEADVEVFKEDLRPFVVAAETTRMPMVFTDAKQANNAIIFANDSFLFSMRRPLAASVGVVRSLPFVRVSSRTCANVMPFKDAAAFNRLMAAAWHPGRIGN